MNVRRKKLGVLDAAFERHESPVRLFGQVEKRVWAVQELKKGERGTATVEIAGLTKT
jgi:hypothetical protein